MSRSNIFQRPASPRPPAESPVPEPVLQEVRRARQLQESGRADEAAAIYRAVLGTWPRQRDCLHYLGVAELNLGHVDAAVGLLRQAVDVAPGEAAPLSNLGAALLAQGRLEEALARLDAALALKSTSAEAHSNRGWALHRLGQEDEALASLERAIALQPTQPRYRGRHVAVLMTAGRLEQACESLSRLVALRPQDDQAVSNLGGLLLLMGREDEARAAFARAIALEPERALHRLRHAVAWLPLVRDDDDGLANARAGFAREVTEMQALEEQGRLAGGADAVGEALPYYLAYQDHDAAVALSAFGTLSARLMSRWLAANPSVLPGPGPDADRVEDAAGASGARVRVRVGIVTAHARSHSVWNAITRGWVDALDRGRFEVHVFHLGEVSDDETARARSRCEGFTEGRRALEGWVEAIRASACEVLLYPEIGMDPTTARLASMRLAPLQAASWGHPITTGLPTIDAYLSAEAMEPHDAEAHYTERLVRLPGLGCRVEPPEADDAGPADPREATGAPVLGEPYFLCPGIPCKYTPRHDALWIRIARAVPGARFVFFRHDVMSALADRVLDRTRRAFASQGLDAGRHVHVLPWQSPDRFQRILVGATACLDTLDFSGFNTALHAVACGVPLVTHRGRFLRGRLGSAVIEHLGLPVADDDDDYVALAARYASDASAREEAVAAMTARRDTLYRDDAPIRALERWIDAELHALREGGGAQGGAERAGDRARRVVDEGERVREAGSHAGVEAAPSDVPGAPA